MDTKVKHINPVEGEKGSAKSKLSKLHPIADMERAFDRFFGQGWPTMARWQEFPALGRMFEENGIRMPNLDVVDRDNDILVRAEIPGVEKRDLDISLTDNLLTIKGHSRRESREEKGDYHRHEISSSSFARSVTLPGAVDSTKAKAVLKDGLLEITLPKLEASKRRSIAIT